MKKPGILFLWLFFANIVFASPGSVEAKPLQVLASVHPFALVAASIVDEKQLKTLLPVGTTPHDFSMRPSDIQRLQQADVVLWAGEEFEPYLQRFVARWPEKVWLDVSTLQSPGGLQDPHWWLSPPLMIMMQQRLAKILGIEQNTFAHDIDQQVKRIQERLQPLKQRGFFVFHRAYDHWVEYFGLKQMGAFSFSPEHKPGVRTLHTMREQLLGGDVQCVFSEPQYDPALLQQLTRGLSVSHGVIDPLGSHISVTKSGYAEFINDLAQRFIDCLEVSPHVGQAWMQGMN